MLFGGIIWGCLADGFGRKRALIFSLFINAFCGFGSSFVVSKYWFMVVRFFSGIGLVEFALQKFSLRIFNES